MKMADNIYAGHARLGQRPANPIAPLDPFGRGNRWKLFFWQVHAGRHQGVPVIGWIVPVEHFLEHRIGIVEMLTIRALSGAQTQKATTGCNRS